jgi:hypothetical protein
VTDHLLQLGSLDLTAPGTQAWTTNPLAEGFDMGSPVALVDALPHLLLDGEVVTGKRSSNRTLHFFVEVRGDDARSLAEAETALVGEVDKPNTLLWKWPGVNTPTTEFQTFRGTCVPRTEDLQELRGVRVYEVTLPAMPFGRSITETVVEALPAVPAVPSTTTLTSGTSTTGWSAGVVAGSGAVNLPQTNVEQIPGDPSLDEGYAWYFRTGWTKHTHEATFTPAAPVTGSATDFLYVVVRLVNSGAQDVVTTVNGIEADPAFTVYDAASASYDFYYLGLWPTIASVKVHAVTGTAYGDTSTTTMPLSLIKVTNDVPAGTKRQQLRQFAVGGSVRCPGTIQVDHETAGLGDVIVYTDPALNTLYRPDLMRWYVSSSGGTPATSGSITGTPHYIDGPNPLIFDVPVQSLPEGGYVLMGRLSNFNVGDVVTAAASTRLGTTDIASETESRTIDDSAASGTYKIVPLATLNLPPSPASSGSVRISLTASATGIICDELWLFYMGEDSALTILSAGAGTPALGSVHNRLDLEAASTSRVMPSLWVGTQANRSDRFHAGSLAEDMPTHVFTPPTTRAFVVTTGADNPAVSYRYRKHWHTHAAED